jgi:Fe2+ transport system protein FeoA
MDKRGMGGAIHIQFNEPDHEAAKKLLSLGFKPVLGKFTYWSK